MGKTGLQIQSLNAYYGKANILQDVCIGLDQGESVVILGRNGMGKSTLLKSILGIGGVKSGGSIRYNDVELLGRQTADIAKLGIGYVPQGWQLFRSLSVEEHLIIAYRPVKGGYQWTPERVFEMFPEIQNRRKVAGTSLSGGEQQILAIGRALVSNGDLILMDEPSEGISTMVLDRIVELCRELQNNGKTILLVEQNLDLAMRLAEKVYILVNGRIVYETTSALFQDDREKHKLYLGI